jgi:copper chaperone CopZ
MKCEGCSNQINELLNQIKDVDVLEVVLSKNYALVDSKKPLVEKKIIKKLKNTKFELEKTEIIDKE